MTRPALLDVFVRSLFGEDHDQPESPRDERATASSTRRDERSLYWSSAVVAENDGFVLC